MTNNPYPEPSLLFTPEEVAAVDWDKVFGEMDKPMNDIDSLSPDQQQQVKAWASRLKRLVKDAPVGIVALIGNGSVDICTEDELRDCFDRDGDLCKIQALATIHDTRCLRPYGESI